MAKAKHKSKGFDEWRKLEKQLPLIAKTTGLGPTPKRHRYIGQIVRASCMAMAREILASRSLTTAEWLALTSWGRHEIRARIAARVAKETSDELHDKDAPPDGEKELELQDRIGKATRERDAAFERLGLATLVPDSADKWADLYRDGAK